MNRRLLTMAAAAAAATIAVAAAAGAVLLPSRGPSTATSSGAPIGGPFRLVDQTGRTVTDADLKGRPTVMFFGFTYCPEVCPTTLLQVSQWLKQLGPDADRLNVAFVSVDPERDTPAQLKLYLSSFDPRIRGLSGPPAAIAEMAKAYRVYYRKVPLEGGDYTLDHSSMLFLFDDQMRFVELIRYGETSETALGQLRRLLGARR